MVVYVEYVLIDNILIDYWLLKFTLTLTKNSVSFWRLLFCSFLGAIFALIFPLLSLHKIIFFILKLLSGLVIVFFSTSFISIKSFIITFLVFLFYTFLLGGSVLGIFNVLGIPYGNELSIAFIFLPVYILFKITKFLINLIKNKIKIYHNIFECKIAVKDKTVKTKGFFDTGNNLYDDKTKKPVIIVDVKTALKLVNDITVFKNLRYQQTSTVLGSEKLALFDVDYIEILINDKIKRIYGVVLGISRTRLNVEYNVILHSSILEDVAC